MTAYLDSSVLVAALVEDEPSHEACLQLMQRKALVAWTHALAEVFATLTGGRLGIRVSPASAAELIRATVVPRVHTIDLGAEDLTGAIGRADRVGVRGGAIFDYLHLVAARRASSSALYTLDARHFAVLARNEGPEIRVPE